MLAKFIIFTAIALISPQVFRGIQVRGVGAAAGVALVFALLNLLIGWLITFLVTLLSLPFIILSLGLFMLVIPTLINAILLRLTDALLDSFHLDGWLPAFAMGFLFALGGLLASSLS
jgi:putative membrane protein